MDYVVIERPAGIVMGIECRTSNAQDGAPIDIPNLWARFHNENIWNQIPGRISEEVVALYCDYEGDCTGAYSVVIGALVDSIDQIPGGMVIKEVPGGKFALFNAKGEHPKALLDTWTEVWQKEALLKRTYKGDYEIYGQKFFAQPQEVDLWVGINSSG